VTTVFVRQGHYATRRGVQVRGPRATGYDHRAHRGSHEPHSIRLPGTALTSSHVMNDAPPSISAGISGAENSDESHETPNTIWAKAIWLDNITPRDSRQRHAAPLHRRSVPSPRPHLEPTIFDEAIGNTSAYDSGIRQKAQSGLAGEELFIELALEDLRRAADLFRPVVDRSQGIDGWVVHGGSHPSSRKRHQTTIDAALRIYKRRTGRISM